VSWTAFPQTLPQLRGCKCSVILGACKTSLSGVVLRSPCDSWCSLGIGESVETLWTELPTRNAKVGSIANAANSGKSFAITSSDASKSRQHLDDRLREVLSVAKMDWLEVSGHFLLENALYGRAKRADGPRPLGVCKTGTGCCAPQASSEARLGPAVWHDRRVAPPFFFCCTAVSQ
jgi:hypothetical protein